MINLLDGEARSFADLADKDKRFVEKILHPEGGMQDEVGAYNLYKWLKKQGIPMDGDDPLMDYGKTGQ